MVKQRSFPVLGSIQSAHLASSATLDELEILTLHDTSAGHWAAKVLERERARTLNKILGDDQALPLGLLASGTIDTVCGLIRDDRLLVNGKWVESDEPGELVLLSAADVAFISRSFDEGVEGVIMRSSIPQAWITTTPLTAAASTETALPKNAKIVAVVDELDHNAVIELVAILPGPKILRRHDGKWEPDDGWLMLLKSIDPPPIVVIDESQAKSVITQVDEATTGKPFKETGKPAVKADGFLGEYERRGDQFFIDALLASKRPKTPKQIAATERLRRYWMFGKGAAKIRWASPGAWTRCHRHLLKYLGPHRAPGYCTNLSQRLGGQGVATHVGVKAKRAIKKALT